MQRVLASKLALIFILSALFVSTVSAETVRFGTLPVLQALPLYVAQEKGLFKDAGVNVEIVPFNTASEKDIALISGSIDGYFGDLVTVLVLRGNDRDVYLVATNYDPTKDHRMFGVLGKPGSSYKSLSELAGIPIAVASNSVVHYVTERLLLSAGVPKTKIEYLESKNIGLRMQMLLSGQVEAAGLPEPLVTAAIAKGAILLGDDSGIQASQTVLAFTGPFLKNQPAAVKNFLVALNKAAALISNKPDEIRTIMVEHVRLPEPLKATYPVPRFPDLHAPDQHAVLEIASWLKDRGIIKEALSYEQVVDAGFLP